MTFFSLGLGQKFIVFLYVIKSKFASLHRDKCYREDDFEYD